MFKSYIKNITEIASHGDETEGSYYSALEEFLNSYSESIDKKRIHVTTLPKKTIAGNPDFRVWDGKTHITGYIEAKSPAVKNLDQIEDSEQLKRYRNTFPNLILTNFWEFRIYRDSNPINTVTIGNPFIKQKIALPYEKENDLLKLFEQFFSFSLPNIYTAKGLAVELAKRTHFLRDEVVSEELMEEESNGNRIIMQFYNVFRKHLINGLTKEEFADLYSQTITYGLFAARTRAENGFNRELAYKYIPRTNGVLRDIFKFVSQQDDLPKEMEWIIDDISEVLAVTDVKGILNKYFHEGKGKDPIIHFYETFLTEYDPKTRERRGIYYTPEPVVQYIVNSLHNILKDKFGKKDGFADDLVTVLDPAGGTLTFPAEATKLAVSEFIEKYGDGKRNDFIREHILKNFYAFELMIAPYAIGHLKMSFLLEELGYKLLLDDRFQLYLTNSLDMEEVSQIDTPGLSAFSDEARYAGKIKKGKPILVILGNPPYSGHSANASEKQVLVKKGQKYVVRYIQMKDANNGFNKVAPLTQISKQDKYIKQKTWIGELIDDYKFVDGKPLGEKNPKWLQDDYVKFIRFGQWKIAQAGEGVLGFITNHSYLDNPTFRGMRRSLMKSFNEIYVLDLHGNSLKKEKCPDGSKDENVFDIKQGVSIALFIKNRKDNNDCKIYHSEIWGLRENKYEWLLINNVKTTRWKELQPKSEFYFFIPRDDKYLGKYSKYPKITEIFPINSVGIVTARDDLTIRFTSNEIWQNVLNFSKMDIEMAREVYKLGEDARDWKIELAQKDIKESSLDRDKIVPILYRPFDVRYTYYTGNSRGFHCMPRSEVMKHMLQENLGLIFHKREELSIPYSHFMVTDKIIEHGCLSSKTTCYLAPLYLYTIKENKKKKINPKALMILFEEREKYRTKTPNISRNIIEKITASYKKEISPEDLFSYIYAVLYSNTYRAKYAEFLKTDFPKIPFTIDYELFAKMARYGRTLIDLHLLKSPELQNLVAKYQGEGNDNVEQVRYDEKAKRVYINQNKYFEGITKNVWQYQVGGYQVLEKWLKERKGKILSREDTIHYCKIIASIHNTIAIQKEIDYIYNDVEKEIIEFKE